ncbi:acyltransferase family protein [Prevotella sp. RM4]|uniref:acyltransferase family protein n=1 Tax=Prevotella sp. RM4 TaxID=1200547 RepID=UPI0009FF6FE3|nr:acyltransferase family protein [Prevotella sp. RM4]
MANRLHHIDNAKAIGMMLIIASHVIPSQAVQDGLIYQTWNNALNSFYVPLFFLLSGIFESSTFDRKKYVTRLLKLKNTLSRPLSTQGFGHYPLQHG